MQFNNNGIFAIYPLNLTRSVIWNFEIKVKTNRNCSLECKVLNGAHEPPLSNGDHNIRNLTSNTQFCAILHTVHTAYTQNSK
jgi:hypothetical protein